MFIQLQNSRLILIDFIFRNSKECIPIFLVIHVYHFLFYSQPKLIFTKYRFMGVGVFDSGVYIDLARCKNYLTR